MDDLRLIVAEPTDVFRRGIANAVRRSCSMLSCVLEEADSRHAMMAVLEASSEPYDLAIYSLDLPYVNGTDDLVSLKARFPLVSYVVYSASDSLLVPQQAFAAGAAGFFRRDSPMKTILQVITIVLGSEAFALPDHLRGTHLSN